jgi:GNAT superfamily N-acetyltransferase
MELQTSRAFILPYNKDHKESLIDSLEAVRGSERLYPPTQDITGERNSLDKWLFNSKPFTRLTGLLNGRPVGHVSVEPAHDYLTNFLALNFESDTSFAEIGKLFVDPRAAGSGIGRMLLEESIKAAEKAELRAALAVVETSLAARRLYSKTGMTEVGTFVGVHGVNHVFVA